MADITLAECDGNTWLVGGEQHIDDLLANTLPGDVTIELLPCDSKSDVIALWIQNCGPPPEGVIADPWVIHPGIVNRIRRVSPDYAVFFGQWSALLDGDALSVIHGAALSAVAHPEAPLFLAEYLDPAGPPAIADLQRLRMHLIEERLVGQGVARARLQRLTRSVADVPGMGQESQRVEIIVRIGAGD
jgi:hypothetical protein